MPTLMIPYDEALRATPDQSHEDLEQDLRFRLGVKLFEIGKLSLGKAAEVAGMKKIDFMDELGRHRIPIMNLDDEQFEREVAGP